MGSEEPRSRHSQTDKSENEKETGILVGSILIRTLGKWGVREVKKKKALQVKTAASINKMKTEKEHWIK